MLALTVHGIEADHHTCTAYACISLNFLGVLPGSKAVIAHIYYNIHVVDELQVGILISLNILGPEQVTLDIRQCYASFPACTDIQVPINIIPKAQNCTPQVVYLVVPTTILPCSHITIGFATYKLLHIDRDYIFEPV